MKNSYKIAGFGLAAGAAVMLALAGPASARGPAGGFGGDRMLGAMGSDGRGLFAVQFADLDSDGDGRVTEAELTARADGLAAARLAEVDADGDGRVTSEELKAQVLARIGDRVGMAARDGARTGRAARDPEAMAAALVERMMSARDADADGVLSGDELSAAAEVAALVDRFDRDDDNAWDAAEFAEMSFGRGDRDGRGHGFHGGRDGKRR